MGAYSMTLLAVTDAKSKRERFEDLFAFQCRAYKLPGFERNHRFAQSIGRQWRFDFAFAEQMLAVEIEGLIVRRIGGQIVTSGRHANPEGFREDCRKYATAAQLGWNVIRFEQTMVTNGEAIAFTQRVLHRLSANACTRRAPPCP